MNKRQEALLAYCATIAFDSRVRSSKTIESFRAGVIACLKEDLPAVGEVMIQNGARVLLKKAEPVVEEIFGEIFKRIGQAIGSGKKR